MPFHDPKSFDVRIPFPANDTSDKNQFHMP